MLRFVSQRTLTFFWNFTAVKGACSEAYFTCSVHSVSVHSSSSSFSSCPFSFPFSFSTSFSTSFPTPQTLSARNRGCNTRSLSSNWMTRLLNTPICHSNLSIHCSSRPFDHSVAAFRANLSVLSSSDLSSLSMTIGFHCNCHCFCDLPSGSSKLSLDRRFRLPSHDPSVPFFTHECRLIALPSTTHCFLCFQQTMHARPPTGTMHGCPSHWHCLHIPLESPNITQQNPRHRV